MRTSVFKEETKSNTSCQRVSKPRTLNIRTCKEEKISEESTHSYFFHKEKQEDKIGELSHSKSIEQKRLKSK